MKFSRKNALYLAAAVSAIAAGAAPALAQDSSGSGGGLGEIVVTAQRQSESVLDVPLSIQAMSGDQLTSSGVQQMSELSMTTPGFTPSNSSGYNQMFIRGIGNSIFVGADPSVATFIDDVPRVFGTLVNNFVNVERVEVIKGAPGALYGRNATGGAVNIITRQPRTDELSSTFRGSYGTKNTIKVSGFVNVPLGEIAAVTVSADYNKHDHYIKNQTRNTDLYTASMFPVNNVAGPGTASFLGTPAQTAAVLNSGLLSRTGYVNEDFYSVNTKLLVQPSDRFKVTFAADYSKKDDDNGNGLWNLTPEYAVAAAAGLLNAYAGASTTPELLAPLVYHPTGKFTTAQRGQGYVRLKDYGVSGTAVLSLDAMDITSITAYRENKSRFLTELGFLPFNYLAAQVDINKSTFYQELRVVSAGEGPLHYIAGASYLRAKFDGGLLTNIFTPVPFLFNIPSGSGRYTVKNLSAYLQLSYDVSDNLNILVSGRYIHEKNDAQSFDATGAAVPVSLKEEKFLPAATVKYDLVGGGNIYARWARGFKAGGIVPVVPVSVFPDPYTQGGIFKGEEVDSYEIGLRAPFAGNRVQVTAAIFYNDYRNVQVAAHARPSYPTVSIAVVNAGSARTYGAELSVEAKVADPLQIGGSVGYLNAKYKTLKVENNPVLEDFDASGDRMINAPKWQLSFHADVDQPISDDWRLVGNVLASYTGSTLWQQSGAPGILPPAVGPSYWLVNSRIGVKSSDDRYELAVYAKNLFNEGYTIFGNSAAAYGNILSWGDPRIVGVEGILNF